MTSSGSSRKLAKLEEDFNGGDPIDLTPYQNVLAMAGSMGFNTEDALEAALITGTTENMQLITDYILSPKDEKKKKYEKKKKECQKEIELSPEQEKAIDELKKYHREVMTVHRMHIHIFYPRTCRFSRKILKLLSWSKN